MKSNVLFSASLLLLVSFIVSSCNLLNPEVIPNPSSLDCNFFQQDAVITLEDNPDLDVDYIIDCQAVVTGDLVIKPGVVIEFGNDAGLEITDEGSIRAVGTVDAPITFTGQTEIPGSWSGIYVESDHVSNQLEYCYINYAGGDAFNSNDDRGAVIIYAGGRLGVDHCSIQYSASDGLNMNYDAALLTSCTQNIFKENNKPIYVAAPHVNAIDNTNIFIGNTNQYVEVGATDAFANEVAGLDQKTWQQLVIPYRVTSTDFGITKEVSIPEGKFLQIEAGVTIEFEASTGIRVRDGGSFKALGSNVLPITLTGIDKAPGAWGGIYFAFTNDVKNELGFVRIDYAGSADWDAAIVMWADPTVHVHDCTIFEPRECVYFDGGAGNSFDNPNFTESNNAIVNAPSIYCFD